MADLIGQNILTSLSLDALLLIVIIIVVLFIFFKFMRFLLSFLAIGIVVIGFLYMSGNLDNFLKELNNNVSGFIQGRPEPNKDFINPTPEHRETRGLPDLIIRRVYITDDAYGPIPCRKIEIKLWIRNRGSAIARNIKVASIGSDKSVFLIPSLQPGQEITRLITPRLPGPPPGTGLYKYTFHYMVDPDNRIREENENNNFTQPKQLRCF